MEPKNMEICMSLTRNGRIWWSVFIEDKNANSIDWHGVARRLSVHSILSRGAPTNKLGSIKLQARQAVRGFYSRVLGGK
jgi:hypothetical protein